MSALTKGVKLTQGFRQAETFVMVKTADGFGRKRTLAGTVSGYVEVWVDASAIFGALASKALRAKSGRAQALHGAVVVVARNRTKGKPT